MRVLKWLVAVPAGVVLVLLIIAGLTPEETADEKRARAQKCADAVTSSMRAPVRSYADKAAYDKRIAADCKGFDIPK